MSEEDRKMDVFQGCWHNYTPSTGTVTTPYTWIDYKSLLEKYVKLVIDAEGYLYLSALGTEIEFTESEKEILRAIERDYENERR